MCDEYDEASGEWIDCIEVCDEYDCTEFTTYHGPICTFKEGCNPIEEISILQSVFYNTHGCTTPCYEKPIKDPLSKEPINSPSEIIQTGIGDKCPDYHTALLEYTEHTFETTLEDEVYCMPEGTQLELSDGAMIECYDVAAQQFGDYWCPENYYYDELLGLCTQSTEICDQGFSGGLEHGCDTPYNPLNDTIWTQYQSDCVDQSASAPKELYDTMCCYDSVFNGFEIYQWGKEETHVKVY
ncbi:MAG: hypothetical protein KQI35_02550 [Bacteroidetes bacterium]|nr:hypothetical protein [Bacteroidota bacterium]